MTPKINFCDIMKVGPGTISYITDDTSYKLMICVRLMKTKINTIFFYFTFEQFFLLLNLLFFRQSLLRNCVLAKLIILIIISEHF